MGQDKCKLHQKLPISFILIENRTCNRYKTLRGGPSLLAAHGQRAGSIPHDLAFVVDAWPTLPEAVRVGIVAMVEAAGKRRTR